MKKNWFITGISRGFGRVLTEELLQQGCHVFGTTRTGTTDLEHPNLTVFKLDVTNEAQAQSAIKAATETLESIDVIVNNAGYGMVGAVEEVSDAEARALFDTNVFGTLNVVRAALPILRAQRSGHIVNFSSVGGFTAINGFGIYNASKFAVEGFSEAMYHELKPLGIHVMLVEPGAFRTDFLADRSLVHAGQHIDDYDSTSGQARKGIITRNGNQPGNPVAGMKVLIRAVNEENPSLRLPLGQDCIDRMNTKIESARQDIERWASTAQEVAFH